MQAGGGYRTETEMTKHQHHKRKQQKKKKNGRRRYLYHVALRFNRYMYLLFVAMMMMMYNTHALYRKTPRNKIHNNNNDNNSGIMLQVRQNVIAATFYLTGLTNPSLHFKTFSFYHLPFIDLLLAPILSKLHPSFFFSSLEKNVKVKGKPLRKQNTYVHSLYCNILRPHALHNFESSVVNNIPAACTHLKKGVGTSFSDDANFLFNPISLLQSEPTLTHNLLGRHAPLSAVRGVLFFHLNSIISYQNSCPYLSGETWNIAIKSMRTSQYTPYSFPPSSIF